MEGVSETRFPPVWRIFGGREEAWELLNRISLHNVGEISRKESVEGCQTKFLSPQTGGNLAAGRKQPMG